MMPRHRARHDKNHTEITDTFRKLGASVLDLSKVGGGAPDLLVGLYSANSLVEIKTEEGELNDAQEDFHRDWRGAPVHIVRSPEDAQYVLRAMRKQECQR